MEQADRHRIDQIIAFHADLLRFRELLAEHQGALETQRNSLRPQIVLPSPEMEPLRQSLLRRAGPIQVVFERVIEGRIMQPQPFNLGPPINVWELALHATNGFSQEHYIGVLADHLSVVIGTLEADPSLLDPPAPKSQEAPSMLQPINVYGGSVNIAQTGSGNVSQTIAPRQELAEVKRLLAELEDAIRHVQAPDDELENFLEPVEQLNSELSKSRPLVSRLTRSWGAIQAFAVINGAWTGWDRVQHLATELGPKAHDLIQALARSSG